jgi:hypothetical protein
MGVIDRRFPTVVFFSSVALGLASIAVPHWLVAPMVSGVAFWIASYAVRDEMRSLNKKLESIIADARAVR